MTISQWPDVLAEEHDSLNLSLHWTRLRRTHRRYSISWSSLFAVQDDQRSNSTPGQQSFASFKSLSLITRMHIRINKASLFNLKSR